VTTTAAKITQLKPHEVVQHLVFYWQWKLDRVHVMTDDHVVMSWVGGQCATMGLSRSETEAVISGAIAAHLANRGTYIAVRFQRPFKTTIRNYDWRQSANDRVVSTWEAEGGRDF